MTLPRDPAASYLARQAVRQRLGDILAASTLDDVALAVSELVANAVLHGAGRIELRLGADERHVIAEVLDEGGGFERRPRETGAAGQLGGWGLSIVGQLADSWGVHPGATHVWFKIPLPA